MVLAFGVDIDDERGREFLSKVNYRVTKVPDFLLFIGGKLQPLPTTIRTIDDFDKYLESI